MRKTILFCLPICFKILALLVIEARLKSTTYCWDSYLRLLRNGEDIITLIVPKTSVNTGFVLKVVFGYGIRYDEKKEETQKIFYNRSEHETLNDILSGTPIVYLVKYDSTIYYVRRILLDGNIVCGMDSSNIIF